MQYIYEGNEQVKDVETLQREMQAGNGIKYDNP